MRLDRINIIGLGYIGFPTALALASCGKKVIGTDIKRELIGELQKGHHPLKEEKDTDNLFSEAMANGIEFSSECVQADAYIISVPTPYDKFSKKIEVDCVIAAVETVAEIAPGGAVMIIESTISPGTTDKMIRPVLAERKRNDLRLAHAPERVIPGNMIKELYYNNRTIGVDDKETGELVKDLYSGFCKGDIVLTDIRTAEMTKVVENTYRAVNIAFANELAKICRHDDMDVYEVIRICNMHPRVNILQPGPGVGGHCISVDPWFLVGDYPSLAKVIDESMKTNDTMPDFVLHRIHDIMNERQIKNIGKVGLYGLTYKENVNDCRESPTLQLLESQRVHLGEPLLVYDPYVREDLVPNQVHSLEKFVSETDMIVIMVGHDEIKDNMNKIKDKVVLDTRNICDFEGVYHL